MVLVGIAPIRLNALRPALDLYPAGALATACGAILISIAGWRVGRIRAWVPGGFGVSTLLGVLASAIPSANLLFVGSGVLFGITFAGLGVATWTSSSS